MGDDPTRLRGMRRAWNVHCVGEPAFDLAPLAPFGGVKSSVSGSSSTSTASGNIRPSKCSISRCRVITRRASETCTPLRQILAHRFFTTTRSIVTVVPMTWTASGRQSRLRSWVRGQSFGDRSGSREIWRPFRAARGGFGKSRRKRAIVLTRRSLEILPADRRREAIYRERSSLVEGRSFFRAGKSTRC